MIKQPIQNQPIKDKTNQYLSKFNRSIDNISSEELMLALMTYDTINGDDLIESDVKYYLEEMIINMDMKEEI